MINLLMYFSTTQLRSWLRAWMARSCCSPSRLISLSVSIRVSILQSTRVSAFLRVPNCWKMLSASRCSQGAGAAVRMTGSRCWRKLAARSVSPEIEHSFSSSLKSVICTKLSTLALNSCGNSPVPSPQRACRAPTNRSSPKQSPSLMSRCSLMCSRSSIHSQRQLSAFSSASRPKLSLLMRLPIMKPTSSISWSKPQLLTFPQTSLSMAQRGSARAALGQWGSERRLRMELTLLMRSLLSSWLVELRELTLAARKCTMSKQACSASFSEGYYSDSCRSKARPFRMLRFYSTSLPSPMLSSTMRKECFSGIIQQDYSNFLLVAKQLSSYFWRIQFLNFSRLEVMKEFMYIQQSGITLNW